VKKMKFKTLEWKQNALHLTDQRVLPNQIRVMRCRDEKDCWKAIREMVVRGAPAIGVTAAYGVYLGVRSFKGLNRERFKTRFKVVCNYLRRARPTARNLFSAIESMQTVFEKAEKLGVEQIKRLLLREARRLEKEDQKLCEGIGRHGARLVRSGFTIMTHCNAGALATAGIGTALSVVYTALWSGKRVEVVATETRPFMQGARLTTWELAKNGVPVTMICDSAVGHMLSLGTIDMVVVGADRIAANGDVANKIGTYNIACLAREHGVPFYVAAPSTTFDASIPSGKQIEIEMRPVSEITRPYGKRLISKGVKLLNPAFDVTPAKLISGIITEKGVFKPPFRKSLLKWES